MAAPFADEAYYTANFGTPSPRVGAELARASRYLRAECPEIDQRIALYKIDPLASGALDPDLAADVVCEMVQSASSSPAGVGVESLQSGAGPFQQTLKYTNPVGDLFLTKKQRRLLGCGGQQAFTVPMAPVVAVQPDGWVQW